MQSQVEIVHVVDGHLFDIECYERTASMAACCERAGGYYVVVRPAEAKTTRFDLGCVFLGPYATEEQAASIAHREAS